MKKSSGFFRKGKNDQDSDSSDDEGNAYFGEALVVVANDKMIELAIDSCGTYHMTHMRDFMYDFKGLMVDGRLDDKELEEKTDTDCLVKEQEKVHIVIKVRANITVTGVHGQEGADGNVAKKKKVKESTKTNLGKLLKNNALSTKWSLVRGFMMRKRC
ncbi:hypothetical protein Tco_0780230 [Tanacetum coccineum]